LSIPPATGIWANVRDVLEYYSADTDRLAASPWQHLGDAGTGDVVRIAKALSRPVVAAGVFP
jgi:hypothetical protein